MAVVLCVSTDDHLSITRRMILESAGHRVLAARDVQQVRSACASIPVEVVVIGQGVPRPERLRIREELRASCPGSKILELYRPNEGKSLADADAWLEVPVSMPANLVEHVDALASGKNQPD
jgi:hypothetical protein